MKCVLREDLFRQAGPGLHAGFPEDRPLRSSTLWQNPNDTVVPARYSSEEGLSHVLACTP